MAQPHTATNLQGDHVARRGEYRPLRLPRRSFADLFGGDWSETFFLGEWTVPPVRKPDSVPCVKDEEKPDSVPCVKDEDRDVQSEQFATSEEQPSSVAQPTLPVEPPSPAATIPEKPTVEVIATAPPSNETSIDPFLDYQNEPAPAAVTAAHSLAAALPAAVLAKPVFRPIDLGPFANQKLADPFPGGDPGNDLAGLSPSTHIFGGVEFAIGDGLVHLGSARVAGPQKVEGIAVGSRLARLHVLHACDWSRNTSEGTVIARFILHFEDETAAEAAVIYGQHVRDWWSNADEEAPPRSKLGWEGENEAVKGSESKIRLWVTTWDNPRPALSVISIDYLMADATMEAASFCVAITAEQS
jgi:hypothetical protein